MLQDFSNNQEEANLNEWRLLPVFAQGENILRLVEYIVEYIELSDRSFLSVEQKETLDHYIEDMMENAILIPVKIARAHCADLYDIKIESATLIRKYARDILVNINGLTLNGFKDLEYLELLHKSILSFRPLFAQWVSTFDPKEAIIDPWGLFNSQNIPVEQLPEEETFAYPKQNLLNSFNLPKKSDN